MNDCPKCKGKGLYAYDENHLRLCEVCCTHSSGVWLLLEHYGSSNGLYCCRAGCGTMWASEEEYEKEVYGA